MGVRLLKPYDGQAVNTVYWAAGTVEAQLIAGGLADTQVELASDYEQQGRFITTATANVTHNALDYIMNSASAQILNLGMTGYWPIGKVMTVSQMGTGATTVVAAAGVTVVSSLSSLVTKGQYSIGQLKKTGPTTWLAFGGFGG